MGNRERAIELRLEGKSRREIAEILGHKSGNSGALGRWVKGVPVSGLTKRATAKDKFYDRAVQLRKQGRSYREIQAEVPVSKSTLSLWLSDVLLEPAAKSRLDDRARAGRENAAASIRARREAKQRRIIDDAKAAMPGIGGTELFAAGLALYWAEGGKAKPWSVTGRVSLINSDPNLIRIFLAWLALIGVEPDRLTFRVAIHETGDAERAEAFWAEQLGICPTQLLRTTIKRHTQRGIRRLPHDQYFGCLRVEVRRSTDLLRQIEGWWQGLVASAVSVELRSGVV